VLAQDLPDSASSRRSGTVSAGGTTSCRGIPRNSNKWFQLS